MRQVPEGYSFSYKCVLVAPRPIGEGYDMYDCGDPERRAASLCRLVALRDARQVYANLTEGCDAHKALQAALTGDATAAEYLLVARKHLPGENFEIWKMESPMVPLPPPTGPVFAETPGPGYHQVHGGQLMQREAFMCRILWDGETEPRLYDLDGLARDCPSAVAYLRTAAVPSRFEFLFSPHRTTHRWSTFQYAKGMEPAYIPPIPVAESTNDTNGANVSMIDLPASGSGRLTLVHEEDQGQPPLATLPVSNTPTAGG